MNSLRRACTAGKLVIVLKGGKTEQGKAAAASHTANLTGSNDIYRSTFRQCGAIEVTSSMKPQTTCCASSPVVWHKAAMSP